MPFLKFILFADQLMLLLVVYKLPFFYVYAVFNHAGG